MNRIRAVWLTIATIAVGVTTATAADLMHFSVTQVRQLELGRPAVRAYLDLSDSQGQRPESLPRQALTATLGEFSADIVDLTPAWTIQQGVAYVFLVDISKSLSPDLFRQMVSAIEAWIRGLGDADRAAILAFGETSTVLVDFTADRESLLAALAGLGPTDDLTLLHQALADALDLSRRLDPDLPGRRVIVVFSDGKDEGSSYEADDVMAKLRTDPAPIYAIGYSRLRDADERRAYLELLRRFAVNSGGTFFAAEQTRFDEAYTAIREAIGDVWIADFVCSECRLDGTVHRLQVKVELEGQALSSGGSVRLLPLATAAAEVAAPAGPQDSERAAELGDAALSRRIAADSDAESLPREPADSEPAPEQASGSTLRNLLWLAVGLALVTTLLVYSQIRAARVRARRRREFAREFDPDFPPGPIDPRGETAVLDPPMPVPYPDERPAGRTPDYKPPAPPTTAEGEPPELKPGFPPKQVRLIVVRGSRKGRQYSFLVDRRAVVGGRSDCDCVLAEEPDIDAEQFELTHESGGLYLRNLSERYPTLITGHPIEDKVRLSSDTLLGTGETVLRIVFF